MITDHGLAALRLVATLNHLHPTLGTTIRSGDRTIVRVEAPSPTREQVLWSEAGATRDDGADTGDGAGVELTPCGFRAATAQAWGQHRSGRRLRLLDLDTDPEVEMTAADGDQVWPSGIARVRRRDVVVYAFGTFLGPDRCRAQATDLLDAAPAPDGLLDLLLQRDTDTEVTVVSAEVEPGAVVRIEAQVLDLFEALLARFATVELLDALAPERARP